MRWIILFAIGAWLLLGNPSKNVANWFWPDSAAPWEKVDAFYYPNGSDLGVFLAQRDLNSVQECRDWVFSMAASRDDPILILGDYECGVEQIEGIGGLSVYRLTVR